MVVPIGQQAGEQVRAAQEGAVGGGGAAEDEVVAAAGPRMTAIEHELLRRQARVMGGLVEKLGVVLEFVPVMGRVDVDLDDARIGGDLQHP